MRLSRRTLLVAGAALPLAACSPVEKASERQPGGTLLWAEEFDTLDLASPSNPRGRWRPNDVWQPLDKGYTDFASRRTWMVNPAERVSGVRSPFSIKDSVLTVTARRTPHDLRKRVDGCPWLGGILVSNTRNKSFGYGYYEFRARFPTPGRGMFPALWFYAARDQNPEWQSAAEIDLFEIFGEATGRLWHSTVHTTKRIDVQTQNLDTAGWHTYGLDWTADHLDFYYDGERTASAPKKHVKFFVGAKMGMRLNFVMDGQFFPRRDMSDRSTPNELHLDVDYIRQYDKR